MVLSHERHGHVYLEKRARIMTENTKKSVAQAPRPTSESNGACMDSLEISNEVHPALHRVWMPENVVSSRGVLFIPG
jgi:hypothetical protein